MWFRAKARVGGRVNIALTLGAIGLGVIGVGAAAVFLVRRLARD